MKNSITACLIVKGDAYLARYLESISNFVDEIIIVINKNYKKTN